MCIRDSLNALIRWLPPGSALDAARNDGRSWSLDDQMVWQLLGEVYRMNRYMRAQLGIKPGKDKMVWPATPWESDENANSARVGSVAKGDEEAAVSYLLGLAPQGPQASGG